jgi:hypothetical protein
MSAEGEIGYKKPPQKYRFKKGISGNPNGRPKRKQKGIGEIAAKIGEEEVAYLQNGRRKRITRNELNARLLIVQALKGDLEAIRQILKALRRPEVVNKREPSVKVFGWLEDYPGQTAEEKSGALDGEEDVVRSNRAKNKS